MFRWKNKKVMITGSSGMIGQELVKLLKNLKAKVIEIDLKKGFDLTDKKMVDIIFDGYKPEYIFHLAGIKGNPKMTMERPVDFMEPMLMFDTNCICAAQKHNAKRFLYTSSIAVEHPETDKYPAWAKMTGETLIEAMRIQYPKGIKYCIVRPANVYGIESLNRDNLMVISDLIKKAKLNGNIELMTDGEEIRDFIHARDVARAMVLTMRNMPDKPIAVGSGKGVKIKTIARLIANKTNSNLKLGKKKADCQKRVMNVKDLKKLGFKQTVKIREGIEEVIKCNR